MAMKLINMDAKCLAFAMLFSFLSIAATRFAEDWQTKILLSSMCLFFVFIAFVLDAWLSFVKEEKWKAKICPPRNSEVVRR